jgi:hypothetical protein
MTKFINDLPELEATYLHEQLKYDPETGALVWIVKRQGVSHGTVAGLRRYEGDSIHIGLRKFQYPAELLVWVMRRGSWPSHIPYHMDQNRSNNLIANLALPVGAHQIKPPRQRRMQVVLARLDATPVPDTFADALAPTLSLDLARLGTAAPADAFAPDTKRNNRGRKHALVSLRLPAKAPEPTALEALKALLIKARVELAHEQDNPPDMSPAPENIAGRTAVIEYTRRLDSLETRIREMDRKVRTMEEQDAQNPMVQDPAAQQPIKGLSTLQGLFAKALGGTPHKIT